MSSPLSENAVGLPAPPLRPFITQYAGFRATGLLPRVHHGLPSSDVDLIISLGPPIDVIQMPSARQRPSAFAALVTGLQNAPAQVRMGREVFGLHVYIRPHAVRAILGVASAELASLVVDLSDVLGNRAGGLIDALAAAGTWPQRFAILDRVLLSRLAPTSVRPEISWAWRRLARAHGDVAVQALAREIGYSRRLFNERFRAVIGVAPKVAARLFRFERACRLIAEERANLAGVAAACGYYDQAHMTHEWRALAGCAPRAWIARELPFLQDYEIGGRDNDGDGPESLHQSLV